MGSDILSSPIRMSSKIPICAVIFCQISPDVRLVNLIFYGRCIFVAVVKSADSYPSSTPEGPYSPPRRFSAVPPRSPKALPSIPPKDT